MKTFKKFMALCLVMLMALTISVPVFAASKYQFSYKGYTRTIGQKVGSIKKKWKLKAGKKDTSCVSGKGYGRTYSRKGLKVYVESDTKGKNEKINQITISNKSYKTKEGVKVGSSVANLKSAYGSKLKASKTSKNIYTASKGGMKITFTLKKNKVSKIVYE